MAAVKDWEIIANNLSKAGWSWGCVSAIDSRGRTIWIADAHRDYGRLTAFLELESMIHRPPPISRGRKLNNFLFEYRL